MQPPQAPQTPAESGNEPTGDVDIDADRPRADPAAAADETDLVADDDDEWASPPPHTRRRGAYILGLITLTGLVVLLMLGLLYHRWLGVVEPTTAIVFEGDETVAGTEIVVDGGAKRIAVTLNKKNNYVVPVLLVPGNYTVTARHNGRVLLRQNFTLKSLVGARILLGDKALRRQGVPPGGEGGDGDDESTADASHD